MNFAFPQNKSFLLLRHQSNKDKNTSLSPFSGVGIYVSRTDHLALDNQPGAHPWGVVILILTVINCL